MIIKINRNKVEIDDNIVNIIVNLNKKNYRTKECCEGHTPLYYTYVLFWGDYFGDNIPKGFKKEVTHGRALLFKRSRSEEGKKKTLQILEKWVDGLEEFKAKEEE